MYKNAFYYLTIVVIFGCSNAGNSLKNKSSEQEINLIRKNLQATMEFKGGHPPSINTIPLDSIYYCKNSENHFGFKRYCYSISDNDTIKLLIPITYSYFDSNYLEKPFVLPDIRDIDRITFYLNETHPLSYSTLSHYKQKTSLEEIDSLIKNYYQQKTNFNNYKIEIKDMGVNIFYSKNRNVKALDMLINSCVSSYIDCILEDAKVIKSEGSYDLDLLSTRQIFEKYFFNIKIFITDTNRIFPLRM